MTMKGRGRSCARSRARQAPMTAAGRARKTPSSTGPGSSGESAGAQISPVRRIGQTTAAAIRAALMISERPAVAPSAFL
jgi:hypothetical protein